LTAAEYAGDCELAADRVAEYAPAPVPTGAETWTTAEAVDPGPTLRVGDAEAQPQPDGTKAPRLKLFIEQLELLLFVIEIV